MDYVKGLAEVRRGDSPTAGGKGATLGELTRAGFPVPPGFVVTTAAYDAFVEANGIGDEIARLAALDPAAEPTAYDAASRQIRALFDSGEAPKAVADGVLTAYRHVGGNDDAPVAVRSSATAEDLTGASFAGQQDTYLNVRGETALMGAVKACWASLWTARAMAYRARQRIEPDSLSLAVVVQQMVESAASGVMFTANPANGRRDEAVIAAAWGIGESVVGGTVATDDVVVDKASGQVRSRRTADKHVMTVYAAEGTTDQPVPEGRRTEPVLDDDTAATLARLGTQVEAHFQGPQDIEWALGDGELFLVQARPVTALPEPVGELPTDWSVPIRHGLYFRASIVEQLPDPLSPLFADLAASSVPRSLHTLLDEVVSRGTLREGDIAFPTINGYAYYYYRSSGFTRLLLWSPAAVRLLGSTGKGGARLRWRDYSHPRYEAAVKARQDPPVDQRPAADLLAAVRALLDAGTEYYTSVQTIVPLAALPELLLTSFYHRAICRPGDPPPATFLLGFDSMPILAEKSLWDLATWTRQDEALTAYLLSTPSGAVAEVVRGDEVPAMLDPAVWEQWRGRFQEHLDRYGHAVYNLDFLNPVPADHPAPLVDTLALFLRGGGNDPYERQQKSASRRADATAQTLGRLDPVRRAVFGGLVRWAQETAPLREDALADMGLAWPLMRRMLLEVGRRLVAAGALTTPSQVFWLRQDDLAQLGGALDAGTEQLDSRHTDVEERKMVWRGQRRAAPPQLLPQQSWVTVMDRWMPAVSHQQAGDTIKGLGASGGVVTAPARVLHGPEDFAQMRPGEVLVAAITTPAWTSLFAMAAAVVTDIGGPLSHSSIVAREYGIPAVLGTGVATRRVETGQLVRVDGDSGTVTVVDGSPALVQPPAAAGLGAPAGRRPPAARRAGVALGATVAVAVFVWRRRRR